MSKKEWVETNYGFWKVEEGYLIFSYEKGDILNDEYLVQVSDLTELTTGEYDELATLLHDAFDYELDGKFL